MCSKQVNENSWRGLFQKSLGMHGDWSFNVFRLIPNEQDPNHKNKHDFNEPYYRVNISYTYHSKIDTKESDGNKVVLHQIMDLVSLTVPNDQAKYPSRVTLLGDTHPVLGLGTNNAIEDAYFLSQALLNKSSENYISYLLGTSPTMVSPTGLFRRRSIYRRLFHRQDLLTTIILPTATKKK
ncbi:12462_t:CDS:2 [Funneliformis mosseae]|uniref:12462_t:CDS:1 n=1 Tax=Funneliformis mosseae TaxID=27381 RepID=A0A9N9BUV1_FUNMO|nr:12462_t:CDS:2 [Funneliformis mosseae]